MYGTGSHPAQLSSYAHACGLMPRNLFLKCGILRALRMGHVKRTLALVFGLAAVLLFAPIARADFPGGKSPYRDLAPLSRAPGRETRAPRPSRCLRACPRGCGFS